MPQKNANVPEGESSIIKEKPIEDTFAAIPDPDEIYAVMREIEAETIPELLGLEGSVTESEEIEPTQDVEVSEYTPEIDGQIELSPLPIIEAEEEKETVDLEEAPDYPNAEEKEEPALEQLSIRIDGEPEVQTQKDEKYDPKNPRKIDSIFEFIELIIFTFLAVMVVSSFFFRHSEVLGTSMKNTLNDGDHLIISNLFYTPERFDIIVCSDYSTDIKKPIVKRVIGIAGDVIKIDGEGNVFLNGELLDEPYVYIDSRFAYTPGEWTVPEGEVFVMGDHRNVSDDSRRFGTVKIDSILGKVLLRVYPFDKFGTVK